MNRDIVIHPFLFAIFPIIFLFSVNVNSVSPEEIIFPLFSVIAVTFLIWIVLGILLKSRIKSGFIVSIGLVLFFSYGHIYILIDDFEKNDEVSHLLLIIPALVIFSFVSYYFIKTKNSLHNLTKIVNIVAFSLVIISFFGIGEYLFSGGYDSLQSSIVSENNVVPIANAETSPDIYYIILDGYSGSKSLKAILDYDNKEFTDSLTNRGFQVASESFSNYRLTEFSLPSTLNMEYVNYLSDEKGIDSEDTHELLELAKDNKVMQYLKSKGYYIITIESGSRHTDNMKNADLKLCGIGEFIKSDFIMTLIRTTILNPIHVKLFGGDWRDIILCGFSELSKLSSVDEKPKFVLAHFMIPHRPYVFGPNGEHLNPRFLMLDENKANWDPDLYLGQLKFASKKTLEVIEKLLDTEEPPIIIIESDHGMRGGHRLTSNTETEFYLRQFNNLKAYYFPNKGANFEFENSTPVNSFRVLFNVYFDENFPLLEDKIYFNHPETPYQLTDVTDFLIQKE